MPTIDRNGRARFMFYAEALDRRTRRPGQHGGVLKRTGLAVLRALLFHFANVVTARCDPSFDTLAKTAGVARSTVAVALGRLEAAGLLTRIRRQVGRVRYSNAYLFPFSAPNPSKTAWPEFRAVTTNNKKPKDYRELSTGPGRAAAATSGYRRRPGEMPTPDEVRAAFETITEIRKRWAMATA